MQDNENCNAAKKEELQDYKKILRKQLELLSEVSGRAYADELAGLTKAMVMLMQELTRKDI